MAKSEYFDDCEVCRAIRAAEERGVELSTHELLAAFQKQKASGVGFVGTGEDFDKIG